MRQSAEEGPLRRSPAGAVDPSRRVSVIGRNLSISFLFSLNLDIADLLHFGLFKLKTSGSCCFLVLQETGGILLISSVKDAERVRDTQKQKPSEVDV